MVREKFNLKQNRQKENYDKRIHGEPFSKDNLVWLHDTQVPKRTAHKFHRPWQGQYKVIKQISDQNYRIKSSRSGKNLVVHFDCLKLCPPDMRLPIGQKNPIPRNLPTKITPPVGSQAEIVEPFSPAGPSEALPSDSSQSRYLTRAHRLPERLAQYTTH